MRGNDKKIATFLVMCLFLSLSLPQVIHGKESQLVITNQQNQIQLAGQFKLSDSQNGYPGMTIGPENIYIYNETTQPINIRIDVANKEYQVEPDFSSVINLRVTTASGLVIENEKPTTTKFMTIPGNQKEIIKIEVLFMGELIPNQFQEQEGLINWQIISDSLPLEESTNMVLNQGNLPRTGEKSDQHLYFLGWVLLLLAVLVSRKTTLFNCIINRE